MTLDDEIRVLTEQEALLQFPSFNSETAWELGSRLRALAAADSRPTAMSITLGGQTLFYAATGFVAPGNEDWVRRKRNTVLRFAKSSFRVGKELAKNNTTLEVRQGLTLADYAAHGGGFPLTLKGSGCLGAVVLSGLTQPEDHELVVTAIAELLGMDVPHLEL
ncbi:heme-degrading domain-containing protein [Terriglobus tenax]|uniref:heme-degrading domain-containing protein n=1 Tax=Terriglobus tenax TaxID=1111115 RepID=UPI0021E09DD4|nr:heme-degrading domain-containing protein [Terriglobus tenax]